MPEWVQCSIYKHVFHLTPELTPACLSRSLLQASLSMRVYIPTLSGYDVWTVLVDNGKQFHPQLCEGCQLRRSTITISCVLGVSNGQVGL